MVRGPQWQDSTDPSAGHSVRLEVKENFHSCHEHHTCSLSRPQTRPSTTPVLGVSPEPANWELDLETRSKSR